MNNNNTTNKFILNLGISPDLLGYGYIVEAVNTVKEMRLTNKVGNFTELYADIADKFNVSASSVERAMRHAIEKAFIRKGPQLKEMFEAFFEGSNKVPNSCFVYTVAEYLIMNEN